MKLSPAFNGFIDYLRGSPVAQQTSAQFFRYDTATLNNDVAEQLAGEIGFAYVVQLNAGTNDNTGTQPFTVCRLLVIVFSFHSGLDAASKNPLESAEVLTDLHGGTYETSEGREVLVQLIGNFLELVETEPSILHSVTFELIQH
jgi:hypothetical protein